MRGLLRITYGDKTFSTESWKFFELSEKDNFVWIHHKTCKFQQQKCMKYPVICVLSNPVRLGNAKSPRDKPTLSTMVLKLCSIYDQKFGA